MTHARKYGCTEVRKSLGLRARECRAQVDLRGNSLGDEGWCAIFDSLRDNPQNKIAKWELAGQGITQIITKSLAAYAAVSSSLTTLSLFANPVGDDGAKALAAALKDNNTLKELIRVSGVVGEPSQAALFKQLYRQSLTQRELLGGAGLLVSLEQRWRAADPLCPVV